MSLTPDWPLRNEDPLYSCPVHPGCYHTQGAECSLCLKERREDASAAPNPADITVLKQASDGGSTSYYDLPEGAITLNDLIEHKDMSFARGNIFKAAYRLGDKAGNDDAYDLRKIIYFAQRLLDRAERGA